MRDVGLQLLQKALANPAPDFRAGQRECIEGILRSQRQLVVQKTGWGKSMVYCLGTRLLRDQREIDRIVSRLYDLLPDEIAQIEGALVNTRRTGGKDDEESTKPGSNGKKNSHGVPERLVREPWHRAAHHGVEFYSRGQDSHFPE